ncbi:MAG: histidine kinase [Coriobacteriales bacterium]|nr:histidine kinase [Coriobacteriales bacterium]MBQ6586382.1 histidine kinase [Coriobacteriales bacterium]
METKRTALAETIIVTIVALLSLVILWSFMSTREVPAAIPVTCTIALGVLGIAVMNWSTDPDRLRARQSDRSLYLANKTLGFMREGLSEESAGAVCELLLPYTNAVAIAITDRERILGFAGVQDGIHEVGERMESLATKLTLEEKTMRVVLSPDEIGLPGKKQAYGAAIVVPLVVRNQAIGTLKFYYRTPRRINETQQSMAEGLGELLSTQLSLAELDAQTELATRMELKALQAQINPHFLFNTLNTISALIRMDPKRARELLREFATFYRRTLENSEDLIAISEEIAQTERYFMFEKARFGEERVKLDTHIEPGLEGLQVPAFIIQPLVENAVNHAMRDEGQLHILVDVARDDDGVVVSVADDGVGIKQEALPLTLEPGYGTGIGIALKNVDDRLKGLFGPESGLRIESEYGVGTTVFLDLKGAHR